MGLVRVSPIWRLSHQKRLFLARLMMLSTSRTVLNTVQTSDAESAWTQELLEKYIYGKIIHNATNRLTSLHTAMRDDGSSPHGRMWNKFVDIRPGLQ